MRHVEVVGIQRFPAVKQLNQFSTAASPGLMARFTGSSVCTPSTLKE